MFNFKNDLDLFFKDRPELLIIRKNINDNEHIIKRVLKGEIKDFFTFSFLEKEKKELQEEDL